jgi:acetyl-CoA carboxylase beta subunit
VASRPGLTRPSDSVAVREGLLDRGSWIAWDDGTEESVRTGEGRIDGHRVALLVSEFAFKGGSIGTGAADRLCAAVERATELRLPLVASTASGGTRMQEGTPAFVRMLDITRSLLAHRNAGLLYLVHLRHPTTGGVLASWGSMGHLTFAEPGAVVALLGPRVVEKLTGQPVDQDVRTANNLVRHGVIDGVATVAQFRAVSGAVLELIARPVRGALRESVAGVPARVDAWTAVTVTRSPGWVTLPDLLSQCTSVVRLSQAEDDQGMIVALARAHGVACVVVGHDRTAQLLGAALGPTAVRSAVRGMELAESLQIPLITVIDTPGAALTAQAETGGIAREVARCMTTMAALTVPSVAVLLGQGAGAAALALMPARYVVATDRSWLSALPLEGASMIEFGDTRHVREIARSHRITAADLYADGSVDAVVSTSPNMTVADVARQVLSAASSYLLAPMRAPSEAAAAVSSNRFGHGV